MCVDNVLYVSASVHYAHCVSSICVPMCVDNVLYVSGSVYYAYCMHSSAGSKYFAFRLVS